MWLGKEGANHEGGGGGETGSLAWEPSPAPRLGMMSAVEAQPASLAHLNATRLEDGRATIRHLSHTGGVTLGFNLPPWLVSDDDGGGCRQPGGGCNNWAPLACRSGKERGGHASRLPRAVGLSERRPGGGPLVSSAATRRFRCQLEAMAWAAPGKQVGTPRLGGWGSIPYLCGCVQLRAPPPAPGLSSSLTLIPRWCPDKPLAQAAAVWVGMAQRNS